MKAIFYTLPDGTEPAKEFMLRLDTKLRAKLARTIGLLEANGVELREPYSKPIGDGIFELRVRVARDAVRVLYFFRIGDIAILTNGFIKKTPKTPIAELDLARKYRKDYLQRVLSNDNIQ